METKLKRSTLYGFAVGDFTFNLLMSMAVNYYLAFLTEVVGLSATTTGTLLIVARIFDAVSVVVTGMLIQKMFFSKLGKFRTWIICVPPITAIFFILMFSNFGMSAGAKVVFLGICYVIAHCCVNFVYNSHMAMGPRRAKNPAEGVALSAKKMQFTTASQVVFGLFSMPIILALAGGGQDMAGGYFKTVIIFALLHVVGYMCLAYVTKPYDNYDAPPKNTSGAAQGGTLAENFKSVYQNKPLLLIMAADSFKWMATLSVLTMATHYFIYVVGDISRVSILFTITGVCGFIGTIIGQQVSKKLEKKTQFILGSILAIGFYLVARLAAFSMIPFVAMIGMCSMSAGIANSVGIAMYSDCSQYWRNKSGKDSTAFIMSMYAMPIKIGVTLAGGVTAYGLSLVNYVPNMAPTAELASGIANIITILPAVGFALTVAFAFLYPLNEKAIAKMREQAASKAV